MTTAKPEGTEIKPCPFCNGTDLLHVINEWLGDCVWVHAQSSIKDSDCPLRGLMVPVERWNRRPHPGQTPAGVRELLEEMDKPPSKLVTDPHSNGWLIGFAVATRRWEELLAKLSVNEVTQDELDAYLERWSETQQDEDGLQTGEMVISVKRVQAFFKQRAFSGMAWRPGEAPEGYKLVPIEPTEAMYRAADSREWDGRTSVRQKGVYQAMVAAAPPTTSVHHNPQSHVISAAAPVTTGWRPIDLDALAGLLMSDIRDNCYEADQAFGKDRIPEMNVREAMRETLSKNLVTATASGRIYWLIELDGAVTYNIPGARWLAVYDDHEKDFSKGFFWTTDSTRALQFARKEDAENFLRPWRVLRPTIERDTRFSALAEYLKYGYAITEHMDCFGPPPPSEPTGDEQ